MTASSGRALVAAVAAFLAVLAVPRPAAGFHPVTSYDKTANEGGGGGVYFTGSPRFKRYDCTMCHIDSDGAIGIELVSEPADLAAGFYSAGQVYTIDVLMVGEHLGGGAAVNENTFLGEFADDDLGTVGQYQDVDRNVLRLIDDDRVIASRAFGAGEVTWRFRWQAPVAGTGAITLYIAMVDGDGAGDANVARTDPLGDDVALLAHRVCEAGVPCTGPPEQPVGKSPASGCSATGGDGGAVWFVAAFALLLVRRRDALGMALVATLASGCFDPITAAECPGRVCGPNNGIPDGGRNSDCDENWQCTTWEAPLGSDTATRTCTDLNNRGTTQCKPDEGPATLPPLDMEYFKCRVSPILQRGCSMLQCHGTETSRRYRIYARGRLRNNEVVERTGTCVPATGTVDLHEAGTATVMCEGWLPHTELEWKKNFDSARSFLFGVGDNVEQSDLLRQPVVGGRPHADVHLFRETDPDYLTIKSWLEGAQLGSICDTGFN